MSNLNELNIGKRAIIKSINHSSLNSRLKEVGISEGKEVEMLFKAAFKGPIAFETGGWVLSIGYKEASHIQIYEQ
jgi:Fe2+ transport system protein FeoA